MSKLSVTKFFIIFAVLASLIAGVWFFKNRHSAESAESDDPNQEFTAVNAADRSLDGVPALALTFSVPLDAGKTVDNYIQVFEMPATAEQLKRQAANLRQENDEEDYSGNGNDGDPAAITAVSTKDVDTDFKGGKLISGAWVVGDNPRILYFPHINPQTRYVVQVKVGLPSKNGKTLASETRYSILTAQVSPAYYFASNGMVLPAKQNGGLPIVTVNVPEVDVQFLKVKDDQLPRFLDRVIEGKKNLTVAKNASEDDADNNENYNNYDWRRSNLRGAVQNYQLDDLRKLTDSVYSGRFVTEQTKNKRSVTYLPVEDVKELKEPGVYVAVMSQPGRFTSDYQTTYFYVSDIGLHTRLYDKSADVFVSSLTDGKAVSGVELSWLDEQGKVLARADSDGDGHAVFAEQPKNAKVLLAKKGPQISMLALKEPALDLSEYTVTGAPYKPVRLFAYSGRNLYRPGESLDLSVVARDADGNGVPAQPIQAKLKSPDGREHFNATWRPDARYPGYFLQHLAIPADAATGSWVLELRADPADKIPATVFKFGVEEFLPERMKLDLNSKQATLKPDQEYTIAVSGNYLYGAPAAGNRLLGVVQFERNLNPLSKQFPGFEFGDVNENEKKTRKELEEQTLSDKGQAQVAVDLSPVAKRHSPFTVRTTLSLLESGGRPVVRSIEKTVWPAPVLVGVRPLFSGAYATENSPVEFEVIRANSDAKLQASTSMPVRLFREDRNYYWRFADHGGWQSGFTETEELVATSSVSIPADARGKLRLPVKYGRYRLEILDPATNQQLVYRFYAGWNAQSDEAQGNRPDRVALKLDKAAYKNGDTAQLTITPPHKGEALITVEGDHSLWVKRMSVAAEGSTVSIPIKEEWKRHDLYVSVIVLRPGNEGDKVTPARALGIVHLPLERGDRKLDVAIEAPAKIKPDTSVKIKVNVPNAKGQKAMVTLSAVDVGILNITKFATPDPHDFFFGRLRYGADLHDVYGRLIEKMAGQKGKLKYGGDTTPKPSKDLPKKVKLVDLFSGPVLLNEQGTAEITLNIPDFNGTLRLMAVVSGTDRYGSKEQEMVVAAPLVAEIATPRFLSLGDNALIALDLTNLSGNPQQFTLNLNGADGLKIGEGERSVSLKDQQKVTLRFPLEARGTLGLQNVNLKIAGKDINIERNFPLMVQAPTQQQQLKRRYVIKPGDTLEVKDAELSGMYPNSVLAHILVSNKAPIDVRAAVQGLLTYPYGCSEQTTSTAYPHVFIDEVMAKKFGLKPYTREQRVTMLDQAISRLATMQAPNGGYSLWGNVSDHEYWLSAYVSNFLVDAREQGFSVPDAMFNKSMDFLLRGLQEGVSRLPNTAAQIQAENNSVWAENRVKDNGRFNVLAFGGYVLSRTNKAPLATLRQLHDSRALAANGLALTQLGIALKQMGDGERSKVALQESLTKSRNAGYWWYDYGSTLRDAALAYGLLQQHQIKLDGSENLLAIVASEMDKYRYYSTQEKLALFQIGRNYDLQSGETWSASLALNGKDEDIGGNSQVFHEITARDLASGFKLKNNFKENIWLELALTGNPVKILPPKNDIIKLNRTLYAPDGSLIGNRPLTVGETVIMHLKVSANTSIGTGMVVDRIPAGMEIENTNIVQGEQMGVVRFDNINPAEAMQDQRIKHVEFRDDRFVVAARIDGQILNLFYRLRVVTPGKFVIPPLYVDDMYRPDVYGSIGGSESMTIVEARPPTAP
ncbi:alpha-2-macroglobulin family protein [Solimicrobium silvestre]|uniref:Large extracellular alpha-helical protein n=1 Tax=Solimicrobium silvestre TaxID=2099400 RepID=A0A2S9H3T8_9BURK|nr:alpha-2-macroglobulin [Solimicrobium silvestre]PRC94638.1 Large extracellular alpha-helical protein [Solimicrobium silvestre]